MSIQKGKEFLEFLVQNPNVAEKMKGFTVDELKQAELQLKAEGKLAETNMISGGSGNYISNIYN